MPIYEYRCHACGRRASLFFRSISVVDTDPACPHCGERRLDRRMSRVWSRRGGEDAALSPVHEKDGVPFYGADPYADVGDDDIGTGYDDAADGGTEDVAAAAREARMMAQMMGEPLDAEFETALRHIEQGADPDDVFGEMDDTLAPIDDALDDPID